MLRHLGSLDPAVRVDAAWAEAGRIADEDTELNRSIGNHGLPVIRDVAKHGDVVNVLTHCNAGWLATVDYGTALAPIYLAHDEGIQVHVWVDETRPRSQGFLTAWELSAHGVPYTLIADNAGGHLMQRGQVDLVIVGADRVTRDGHVCNKIGTYLKALFSEIPIEERSADEIRFVHGLDSDGQMSRVTVGTKDMQVANPGFDVTPAELISGIITEAGVIPATRDGLASIAGK
jgi:methylthioribose-1-phosphate isomerase